MRIRALLLLLPALVVFGCGETKVETPVACLEGEAAILTALESAPDPVRLNGETPISGCLVRNQPEGQLLSFGEDALLAATELAGRVRAPGEAGVQAALEAGYLVGALEKGSEDSEGIHSTLVNRVSAAAGNGIEGAGEIKRSHFLVGHRAGAEDG